LVFITRITRGGALRFRFALAPGYLLPAAPRQLAQPQDYSPSDES